MAGTIHRLVPRPRLPAKARQRNKGSKGYYCVRQPNSTSRAQSPSRRRRGNQRRDRHGAQMNQIGAQVVSSNVPVMKTIQHGLAALMLVVVVPSFACRLVAADPPTAT